MTEITLLASAYYFEAIGQGEEIRHTGTRGEFHNVAASEANRLLAAGLAVKGRVLEADLPAATAPAPAPLLGASVHATPFAPVAKALEEATAGQAPTATLDMALFPENSGDVIPPTE